MTFVSTLGQSLDQIERLKQTQLSLATLQAQISSGKKTNLFKGLGTDVITSERARASTQQLETYSNNITIADRRIKMMAQSMEQLKTQVENVVNAIQIQTQKGEFEMEAVSDLANKAATFVRDLLNTQDGDRFLFAGAESRTQPITDNGTMDTYMQFQLGEWVNGNIDTDELISSYRDPDQLNDTLVGYSATLSSGSAKSVYVRVDEQTEIDFTVFANDPGLRDMLVALEMTANIDQVLDEVALDPDDDPLNTTTAPGADKAEQNDNFFNFFNDLAKMMNQGLDKMEQTLYSLSQDQAQISQIQEGHEIEKNIMADTIADVEDIDLNEVAVKLNALQVQLEASYRVTATLSQLSLVNFL
ncbi:MAG TPA: hypothetical protein EYG18_09880 [Micavibrio sp.]|nr:hypothetical protein [Pseudomonadota bacterium]HIF24840.1 hypothetical protein [Micavibrio sp.]HIL29565.1 hypothetical protein [Micavibrio sp.]